MIKAGFQVKIDAGLEKEKLRLGWKVASGEWMLPLTEQGDEMQILLLYAYSLFGSNSGESVPYTLPSAAMAKL